MIQRQISHHMTELPHTVGSHVGTHEARSLMTEFGYHHLPVLEGAKIVGILSERDLRLAENFKKDQDIPVSELMSNEIFMVSRDADIKETISQMIQKGVSSTIVKGDLHAPWGIFTTTDALRLLIAII